MEPQVIDGKYQIVRMLGQGGMGAVYEARHTETSRRVAVKVIASGLVSRSGDTTARFKREAKAAGAIETQHVVQVLDAGSDPATQDPYIVMELLSGEDLKQLVTRVGPLSPDLALRVAAQACVGLQAAHDAGIIHRDVKSANLFLSRRENGERVVKVVDFGIAKVVAQEASPENPDLTNTGSIIGSPRYVSPEQAKGQRDVTTRSDLWSLGVVLYEMLTGTTPHAEIDGVFMIMTAICNTPAPPVQTRAPWVPAEHAALCHKLLQIDPKDRFASAADTLEAIRALLPGGLSIDEGMLAPLPAEVRDTAAPLPVSSSRSFRTGTDAHGTGETALNVSTGAVQPVRSRRWPTLVLAALLVGAAAGAYKLQGEASPSGIGAAASTGNTAVPAPARSAPEPAQTANLAPAPEPRHAKLAVEPADAAVEIDGQSAAVKDGAVDLTGALGSVHHVRAVKGSDEAQMDVAITAQGAVPASLRVQLTAARPGPKPAASGTAAGRTPGTPPPSTAAPVQRPNDPQPATKWE